MLQPIKPQKFKHIDVSAKQVNSPAFLQARGLKLSLDEIIIRFDKDKKSFIAQLGLNLACTCLGAIFVLLIVC